MRYLTVLLICCISAVSFIPVSASSQPPFCPAPIAAFPILHSLRSQCPLSPLPISLLHVDGDFLEKALASDGRNAYSAVFFYASWCPFSQIARMNFDVLSSMYPQIEHLAIEQSAAMPSLFSRYGIHSIPSVLMVNKNLRKRFHGSVDVDSLIEFYKQTTGSEPVQYIGQNQSDSLVTFPKSILQSWIGSATGEIMAREPCLVASVVFVFLRVVIYVMPRILHHLRPIWATYRPCINLEIFGETAQILGCILHIIDLKRVWSKLRLSKNRNLHRGARNASVWASSLASVSLGKTSTSRWSS